MADSVRELIKRFTDLRSRRQQWETHWDDLARVQLPRRLGFVTEVTEGSRRDEDVFDGTPMQSARGLANALGHMLRSGKFFFLRAGEGGADDEAREWLGDTEERMREAFDNPRSRFRQTTGEADLDLVVFGTAVIFESESPNLNQLLFQSVHLKDAYVFFGENGEAEGIFRLRIFPLRQAEAKFGRHNLSLASQKALENNELDKKVSFLQAVVPRKEGRVDALLAQNMPIANLWIEFEEQKIVFKGGFHEFPFIIPRWDTSSGEDYGRSPGMIALPDSNTAQAMQETLLIAGQRAADPPLGVPDDGMFNAANTFPGGLSYYNLETAQAVRGNPIFPIETGANIPINREMQNDMREQIRMAFFRNIFNLPVEGPQMTATEVNVRKEEFIREMGPVFGRFETDYTAPMVTRAFNIMLRAGAFAPIPPSLQGGSVRFEYESPVKKIRQQIEASAAGLWVQEMLALTQQSEGQLPSLDLVNIDAYGRFTADASGIPYQIVNGQDAVGQIRQARAEAQEQAAQAEQAQQVADTAATAGGIPGIKDALEEVAG